MEQGMFGASVAVKVRTAPFPQTVLRHGEQSDMESTHPVAKTPHAPSAEEEALPIPAQQEANSKTTKQSTKSTEQFGYLLMVLAAIAYTGNNVLVHMAEATYNMKATTSVFIRALIQVVLSGLFLVLHSSRGALVTSLSARQARLLLLRGLVGGFAILLLYSSFGQIGVGDGVAIFYCTPVFTLALARIVLAEPIGALNGAAALFSVVGVALISRAKPATPLPRVGDVALVGAMSRRSLGAAMALGSAALTSIGYTTVRYLGTSIHFMTSVCSMGLFALVISIALGGYITPGDMMTHGRGSTLLVVSALCGFVAQCCMNKGLQMCHAGPAVLVRNVEVPLVYTVGFLLLGEQASWVSLVGAFCVVVSAFMIGFQKGFQ